MILHATPTQCFISCERLFLFSSNWSNQLNSVRKLPQTRGWLVDLINKKFNKSLIIHEEKTKEIITVEEGWICDPNYLRIINALRSYITLESWLTKTRLCLVFSTHFSVWYITLTTAFLTDAFVFSLIFGIARALNDFFLCVCACVCVGFQPAKDTL